MDPRHEQPSAPRLGRRPPLFTLLPGALITVLSLFPLLERPALASTTMGQIVRAFCLSAFETEMSQAGKTAPQGMANFACDCVEQRLSSGSSLEGAKRDCRQATARRYPI